MYPNLCPGAVGLGGAMADVLPLAERVGFSGVDPNVSEPTAALKDLYGSLSLRVGSVGLPLEFRDTEAKFRQGLADLPDFASRAQQLQCTRCATWLRPASDTLTYRENFVLHVRRLRPVAEILARHGLRLGLEFVGPATSRQGKRCEFIHTLAQLQELRAAIGVETVGILLDAWHWYTSGSNLDELRELANDDVVLVHVSDAPAAIPVDEQLDNKRELPGQTGVIDLAAFMGALDDIGYDGPVSVEPFCERLQEFSREERAEAVVDSLLGIMP
ncbi:MAG: sugar phosphate isomerase/epimerase [Victivallales bacterium]|jgi:sugar phosphate isomerase/epimerase|nr:sugar phosphate isomerase/epimerase [Victivallales bacterium]MBT7165305.1 sugar phosphate isomerase/epimerase [Victivallales bacterium]MBT7297996.1 sugar phosphate isomerase/epimerase [Victivallales bacterium]